MLQSKSKRIIFISALMVLFVTILIAALRDDTSTAPVSVWRTADYVFVLDAGHGGVDSGAISPTGLHESHINLQIALRLEGLLNFYGYETIMTRRTDISIHDDDARTIRAKKRSDLHNRAELVNNTPNALLVSIHQNTFGQRQYRGLQVFYANGANSMADRLQTLVGQTLAPGSTRLSKPVPRSIYLFGAIDAPSLLVECGFLTNPQDEQLLVDEDYQRKLAAVILAALVGG